MIYFRECPRFLAYYRRVSFNKGASVAVFATARKLGALIYRMLRWRTPAEACATIGCGYAALRDSHSWLRTGNLSGPPAEGRLRFATAALPQYQGKSHRRLM